jgi:alcohol dehydrogenase (NADP+)
MKLPNSSVFPLLALIASPVYSVSQQQQQYPLENPTSSITQPLLGFGTWNLKISDSNTTAVVSYAIQTGYRQIDCAAIYGNEVAVGKGIKDGLEKAGLKREEIWVTSKLWNDQ